MSIIGLRLLQRFPVHGSCKILSSNKMASFIAASSCKFSTTNHCIQQSSPEEFILKHQKTSARTSNSNWLSYRVASLGLLGGLAACAIFPGNILVDYVTVTLLVHHNHFGMKSVIADYAPLFFNNSIVNIFMYTWLVISVITLALLYCFNYNGIGFSNALVKFFKL